MELTFQKSNHASLGLILDEAESLFSEKGVENARADAEWLLAHVLKIKRPELGLWNGTLSDADLREFSRLVTRRSTREPLQYILESQDFHEVSVAVRPGALIPRPETELLVERALRILRLGKAPLKVLDLGTGTACIPLALVEALPHLAVDAVEISEAALALARENIAATGREGRIRLFQGDLFETPVLMGKTYDLIISNPPYVPSAEIAELQPEVSQYEPHCALNGGIDGLDLIKKILLKSPAFLSERGYLILEFGFNQAEQIRALAQGQGTWSEIQIFRDLREVPRILLCRR